jgi:lysophospholipase L1-like esterase
LGVARNSYIFDNASGVSDDETEREFREIMTEARAQAERLGSKMYFVYLPSFNSLIDDKYTLAPDSQRVRKVVSELGIPLIDFYAYLKATKDPAAYFPFHEGGHHYNPQGYDLLADLVESSVLKASIPKTGNL